MIPQRMKEAIDRYVADHIPVGGFLEAVLSNDLTAAFGRADEENRANLYDIIRYCYWKIPGTCWGSPAKVEEWVSGTQDMPDDREAYYNEKAEELP